MRNHRPRRRRPFRKLSPLACLLAALCLVFSAQATLADEDPVESTEMRTFAELLAIAEQSDVSYELNMEESGSLTSAAETLWPAYHGDGIRPFVVKDSEDGRSLELRECSASAQEALKRAEASFRDQDMTVAALGYRAALAADPDCYDARLYLGDAHLHSRRFIEALGAYEAAVELNPLDYRGHFFRGSALLYLDRQQEAQEAFVEALTLKPKHDVLLQAVEHRSDLGLQATDTSIEIPIRLEVEEGKIRLTVADEPIWLSFGLCKAVQVGEAEVEAGSFSLDKELECFANLLASYITAREDNEIEANSKLDWLVDLSDSGHLDSWILYEFGSRLSPYVTVLIPEAQREELRRFVRDHVLVPTATLEPATP